MAMYWYLLKVCICIIAFYGFYILVLRKSTFFFLNRLYLLLSVLASFAIPALNVSIFQDQSDRVLSTIIHPVWIETEYDFIQPQNLSAHVTTVNYSMLLSVIYFTVMSILFFRLLFSIIKISRIRSHSTSSRIGSVQAIITDSDLPFSFFNMIFLSKNGNDPMIINHEIAHIKQFHWVDLVIIELASLLLWFNPFIFLLGKSLRLQHEYLADASVTSSESQIERYLTCMLRHIQVVSYGGMTSQFYCKTIKKRIIMITKNKTSKRFLGVYLLVLPLVCLMLFAFSGNKVLAQNGVTADAVNPDNTAVQNNRNQPSVYPVDSEKVRSISGYGERMNPKTKEKRLHSGVDFAVNEGENVVSTADGVVVEAKFDSKKGNYVIIQHDEIFSTFYSHLKSFSVKAGDKLTKGQLIGHAGNTGLSTGVHMHYEVFKNGENVDPKNYLPE